MREHKGDYGIDGSFHTVSARGQAIGVGGGIGGPGGVGGHQPQAR